MNKKIAVVSDDGERLSMHFGKAKEYVVFSVEDGKVTSREVRDRSALVRVHHGHGEGGHQHSHGHDHTAMANAIADCQVLLTGGMGRPAYESMRRAGLETIVTDIREIERAVQAYIDGTIDNRLERLH
jgi:predicted Fe-Mo cluster-binding NifX family protein